MLYRIAHNQALNTLRAAGAALPAATEEFPAVSLEAHVERREELRETLHGIRALPERQRAALVAVAVEDRTHADVAAELGMSDGALRQLLLRARTTLRAAASALTPYPLVTWLAGGQEVTAVRVADVAVGAGGAGVALKAGIVALAAGAVVARGPRAARRPRTSACEGGVRVGAGPSGGGSAASRGGLRRRPLREPPSSQPGPRGRRGRARARAAAQAVQRPVRLRPRDLRRLIVQSCVTRAAGACPKSMSQRTLRTVLLLASACAMVLAFPASGMARSHGDRNRDGIPDRWEHAHHLSLKVNQAKRDQDHDGLRNKAEFMAGDNPRDADTDNDGIKDGREKAGQVVSFTGGVLTVHLFNGDDVKGTVDADTEIECDDAAMTPTTTAPAARAADDGGGDNGDGDHQGGDHQGPGDDGQGDDDQGDDNGNDQGQAGCDATKLTPGAVVQEAELKATAAGLVFEKIELVG